MSVNVFDNISIPTIRTIADNLGVKRQILTAFRMRLVIVDSIPEYFLQRLAGQLICSVEDLTSYLSGHHKPQQKVTFETLLRDSLLTDAQVKQIMEGVT